MSNLVDEPDALTRLIIDTNLYGVIIGTKLVAPGRVERGRGHIIDVASAAGASQAPTAQPTATGA